MIYNSKKITSKLFYNILRKVKPIMENYHIKLRCCQHPNDNIKI